MPSCYAHPWRTRISSAARQACAAPRLRRCVIRSLGLWKCPRWLLVKLHMAASLSGATVRLNEPLRGVVAAFAETLERTKPEFIDVAVMWLDVIADFCRRDDAALRAILTQRMLEQLVPSDSSPASRGVPLVPLRRSAVSAHRLNLSSAGSRKTTPDMRGSRLAKNLGVHPFRV
jgi:hypothetical protein